MCRSVSFKAGWITPKMEAESPSETLATIYWSAWLNISQDWIATATRTWKFS